MHQLDTPNVEIVEIAKSQSDAEASETIRGVFKALEEGRYGKKVLLKLH